MKFNPVELINVLIVLGLLKVLLRKRDAVPLLLVLFVCGTFHFSFAVIALTTNDTGRMLIDLHNEGGGLLARLSTLILLVVVFSLLGRRTYEAYSAGHTGEKKELLFVLLLMAALFCGYLLNYRTSDLLQLKNIVSIEAMFVLVMLGSLATTGMPVLKAGKVYAWGLAGLLILGIIDAIAMYEVLGRHSWAGTLESSGAYVYRASSVLFNPNLYAFWASLVYLASAYGIHVYGEQRRMLLLGMVLASTAIYLSGSRSAGYLLLAALFLPLLLIRERRQWLPLLVLPLTMLAIYAGAAWLAGDTRWQEIALLGERFASAPVHLINYSYQYLAIPVEIPAEIRESIEGRFIGAGRDAGWLVLYQDAGWVGLSAVIIAGCLLVGRGIRAYLVRPSPASVYTLALLLYCLLTGLLMRLQIFPVWLFIGLVLIICMVYWRPLVIASDRERR